MQNQIFSVLFLAAGLSRRMNGPNKMLLPFGQKPLAAWTFSHLLAANLGEIVVVLGHQAENVRAVLEAVSTGFPQTVVRFVKNPQYETGLTSSIQAGVQAASEGSAGFMICLADMPTIPSETYTFLKDIFYKQLIVNAQCIIQPIFEKQPGHPVIFSAAWRSAILALDFPDGCRPILQKNAAHRFLQPVLEAGILLDADTPEAFEQLWAREKHKFL